MFRVIVHDQAKSDIVRNADWWAKNHSVSQALDWVDAVERQLQALSTNPERFGVAPENDIFPYEIRHVPVGLGTPRSYRAVYTIREDVVHILTVLRATQDDVQPGDIPDSV